MCKLSAPAIKRLRPWLSSTAATATRNVRMRSIGIGESHVFVSSGVEVWRGPSFDPPQARHCNMSALGHKQTLEQASEMSALPLREDTLTGAIDVRFVPAADMPGLLHSAISHGLPR